VPSTWSTRTSTLWPPPCTSRRFCTGDFHPGNVLWEDGKVSGLVDWVEKSTGPADLDVAHCASNLSGLHGVETALAFRRSYVDQGGRLAPDADASAYWQLLDLTPKLVRARREELLRVVLAS
jgi:aminoglycoside phosphotransferase (APT) family kinase protein